MPAISEIFVFFFRYISDTPIDQLCFLANRSHIVPAENSGNDSNDDMSLRIRYKITVNTTLHYFDRKQRTELFHHRNQKSSMVFRLAAPLPTRGTHSWLFWSPGNLSTRWSMTDAVAFCLEWFSREEKWLHSGCWAPVPEETRKETFRSVSRFECVNNCTCELMCNHWHGPDDPPARKSVDR